MLEYVQLAYLVWSVQVRQRTQLIDALRGHLAERGIIAPQGPAHLKTLAAAIDAAEPAMPQLVLDVGRVYLEQVDRLSREDWRAGEILRRKAPRGEDTPTFGPRRELARSRPWRWKRLRPQWRP